jgi:1-acyl-sn-glycerol-3-phosphate acyltransferase
MFKTALIYTWTVLSTVVVGSLVILFAFFSKTGNLPHILARFWARSILFVSGIRVTVTGISNIRPGHSCIFMVNHQSNFDIPVLLGYLPVQFRWLAKAELFKIPLFGRAMRGCGYISIDRANRKSAFLSLARAAATIRDGASVLIFPEGTRSADGKLNTFKKGGFVLTVDAGVPIIPVIIHGTWWIMPRNRLRITPRSVTLDILPPIDTSVYNRKNKDELMETVRSVMCEKFEELRGEPACS